MIPTFDPCILVESIYSLSALESKLVSYISDPDAAEEPFDVSSIPKVSREQAAKEAQRPSTLETIGVPSSSKASTPPPPSVAETQTQYAQQLAEIPEFASYGQVLHSSTKPAQLTERETEYQASCVKHIFDEHIVFQVRHTLLFTNSYSVSMCADVFFDSSMYQTPFPIPYWKMSLLLCNPRPTLDYRTISLCPFPAFNQRIPLASSTSHSLVMIQQHTKLLLSNVFSNS